MEIERVEVVPPGDEKQIDGVWRVWVKCPDCGLERWVTKTNTQRGTFTGLCKSCSLKLAIQRGICGNLGEVIDEAGDEKQIDGKVAP